MGATPTMNRSAKGGARSSPHYREFTASAAKTRVTRSLFASYSAAVVLPTLGTTELIKAQDLSQSLLRQGLFRKNGGYPIWPFFALRRIEQSVLLNLA